MNFEEEFSNDTIKYHSFMKAVYEWSDALFRMMNYEKD
jgi:hypothetical protein